MCCCVGVGAVYPPVTPPRQDGLCPTRAPTALPMSSQGADLVSSTTDKICWSLGAFSELLATLGISARLSFSSFALLCGTQCLWGCQLAAAPPEPLSVTQWGNRAPCLPRLSQGSLPTTGSLWVFCTPWLSPGSPSLPVHPWLSPWLFQCSLPTPGSPLALLVLLPLAVAV